MGKPLSCRLGKHSWKGEGIARVKTCIICGDSKNEGSKPTRCWLGHHSFVMDTKKRKYCKFCGKDYEGFFKEYLED